MPGGARMQFARAVLVIGLMTALSSCGSASVTIVETPDLLEYDPDFQGLAATEVSAMPPPCPRDVVIEGCSAVHRLIKDYGLVRDQIRALQAN